MRVFWVILLGLVVVGAGSVALLPISMVTGLAGRIFPDLRIGNAAGTVWDGRLTGVSLGTQNLGDFTVRSQLAPLLSGKAVAQVTLTQPKGSGSALIALDIFGNSLEAKDLRFEGDLSLAPFVPSVLAQTDGRFGLEVNELRLVDGLCEKAVGDVWTNVLTRQRYTDWAGPELRGPLTCRDGELFIEVGGTARNGESIVLNVSLGLHGDVGFTAVVGHAGSGAVKALSDLGFKQEGELMVLRQSVEGG